MPLFHASPPAGRRQRTTATEPSEIASGWPLEILPLQSSRSLRLLAPTFPAEAHRPRNAALTQPQAPLRANGHGPATRPFRICDGIMAIRSFLASVVAHLRSR